MEKLTKTEQHLFHIDSLKGLAIILIIFFHLGSMGDESPLSLSGGYIGVEIFLTITGYLLLRSLIGSSYDFKTFITKKLHRLLYPISCLTTITLILGIIVFDYKDLLHASTSSVSSLLGLTNIYLSRSSFGYFSTSLSFNPLMHLWYASLTLQFYVAGYLLYMTLKDKNKIIKISIFLVIFCLSFLFYCSSYFRQLIADTISLPEWFISKDSLYFSPLARLWQPLLAVLLFIDVPHKKLHLSSSIKSSVCIIALFFIIFEAFYITPFAEVIVVFSTLVLIKYVTHTSTKNLAHYILDLKIIKVSGRISFSLYLVHVPIIVLYKAYTMQPFDVPDILLILSVTFCLGSIFYHFFEKRKVNSLRNLILWIGSLGIALLIYKLNGLKNYIHVDSNNIDLPAWNQARGCHNDSLKDFFNEKLLIQNNGWKATNCSSQSLETWALQIGNEQKTPSFIMLGDSHIQHLLPGMDIVSSEINASGIYLSSIIIPFHNRFFYKEKTYFFDRDKSDALFEYLKAHPELETIFIAQLWQRVWMLNQDWSKNPVDASCESNMPAFRDYLISLRKLNKRLVVFGPIPYFKDNDPIRLARYIKRKGARYSECIHKGYVVNYNEFINMYGDVIRYLQTLEQEGLCTVIYPHQYLFTSNEAHMIDDDNILWRDNSHISVTTSIRIADKMKPQLKQILLQSE